MEYGAHLAEQVENRWVIIKHNFADVRRREDRNQRRFDINQHAHAPNIPEHRDAIFHVEGHPMHKPMVDDRHGDGEQHGQTYDRQEELAKYQQGRVKNLGLPSFDNGDSCAIKSHVDNPESRSRT